VCAGPGGFEVCLGFCPPYLADQCPEAQMCVVQEGLQGYCDVAGQAGLYESCQEQVCAEGLACAESGQGAVCLERCVPSAVSGGEGSCAQGQECEVIGGRDLGVCRHVCDLFDSARACPEAGQGCTVANEREGTCVFRGEFGLGNRCENSPQCQAPLQCLVGEDEGVCSRMCLRSAAEGEEGSCPEGKTCRMTGFGSLGVCR